MNRIDRQTVQRIIDTADIVDVVSDFVKLKRSGSGYIGLCPFHNDRTPSFKVSKAKNICKCFACNQGGSPVNFIMLHEKLSYQEALRYLAKKYNIEIKEHELTEQEREEENERESLLGVNEFALDTFRQFMSGTPEGRNVGLAYFRQRGISDAMIDRFRLGYSPEDRTAFSSQALAKGYAPEVLIKTGLCSQYSDGQLVDRFRGRVIYPIFKVSGKVVAFGGRTLRNDKQLSKYINSPESVIYSKSNELYGLYQSKSAIARKGKCILVEGYMDVISMHQAGVENVVASSGTALTTGQVRLIHRFTDDVTVIYDSDAAGIKASLRSIDILLAEGMNIKVLQLPDGEDPDSFAQTHSSTEVEEYLAAHEEDFIRFKTRILLTDADDPTRRASVISEVVRSISVIPDQIRRNVYIDECSRLLGISDKVLLSEMTRMRADTARQRARDEERDKARESLGELKDEVYADRPGEAKAQPVTPQTVDKLLYGPEMELARYLVRYGMVSLGENPLGDASEDIVAVYIANELEQDELTFTTPGLGDILDRTLEMFRTSWAADSEANIGEAAKRRETAINSGIETIRQTAEDLNAIEKAEKDLIARCDEDYRSELLRFRCAYVSSRLLNDADDTVRNLSTAVVEDRYALSKIHTRYAHVPTELERLPMLVPRAIYVLKNAWVEQKIKTLTASIASMADNTDGLTEAIEELSRLNDLKKQLAVVTGDRVITRHV